MLFSREGKQEFDKMLDYKWFCRQVDWSDMIRYLLNMFEQLGFTKALKISNKTLISFVLTARMGYRDLPYHNWAHAFSVAHFSFLLMFRLNLIHRCLITLVRQFDCRKRCPQSNRTIFSFQRDRGCGLPRFRLVP